jgi:hypothetical protein
MAHKLAAMSRTPANIQGEIPQMETFGVKKMTLCHVNSRMKCELICFAEARVYYITDIREVHGLRYGHVRSKCLDFVIIICK